MQLFVFDHYMEKLKTILTENEVSSAVETKEINKAGMLDLELSLKTYDILETDMLLIPTEQENKYHVYRIINRVLNDDTLQIKANEYAYHLFLADGIVHDKRPQDKTVREVIEQDILWGQGGWEVGYVDEDLPKFTGNFYRENRLSCLSKIKEACNVEFDFVFTVENNKIKHRYIECYDEVGIDTRKRFEYGDNALSVIAETDASSVFTRAFGWGKGLETENGGYGRKLDLKGLEWKAEDGYPVYKSPEWDFMLDTRGDWKDYQLDNGTDPSTSFDFSDCEDQKQLAWLTWNALQEVNRPKVHFKAQLSYAGDLNLGDRLHIVRPDLNIRYKTRVFKIVRNLVAPELSTVELGDKVGTTTGEMIDSINKQINSTADQITDIKTNINLIENNTGNHIAYGPDKPTNPVTGDVWFETTDVAGGKQTTIHVWNGEQWITTLDPTIFEEAKKAAEEALKHAQESVNKVDGLVDDFEQNKIDINVKLDGFENAIKNTVSKEDFEATTANLGEQITQTVKKVNDLSVGAVNLIENSESLGKFKVYRPNVGTVKYSEYDDGWQKIEMKDLKTGDEFLPDTDIWKKLEKDVTYTQQLRVKTDSEVTKVIFTWYDGEHHEQEGKIKKVADNEWIVYDSYVGTGREVRLVDLMRISITNGSYVSFCHPQLEMSSIPSDYGPSPKDFPTSEEFSELTQRADGIQASVTDLGNKTEGKLTVLDNAIQATVEKIGAKYPNGKMDNNDVKKFYDVNDENSVAIKESPYSDYIVIEPEKKGDVVEVIRKDLDLNGLVDGDIATVDVECFMGDITAGKPIILINFFDENDKEIGYTVTESDKKFGNWQHWTWGASLLTPERNKEWYFKQVEFTVPKTACKARINVRFESLKDGASVRFRYIRLGSWTSRNTGAWHWEYMKSLNIFRGFIDEFTISGSKAYEHLVNNQGNSLVLIKSENNTEKTVAFLKEYLPVDETEDVILKFKSKVIYPEPNNEGFRASLYAHFYNAQKEEVGNIGNYVNYDVNDRWQDTEFNYGKKQGVKYVRFEYVLWHGNERNEYAVDDVLYINGEASVMSAISMAENNINLAVNGENIINQINISPEGINIDGEKLHITADTWIDKAVIDSANIKEINGDKVNVVNIRAENITGNRTQFVQTWWNDINNSVYVDSTGIRLGNSAKQYIKLSANAVTFFNGVWDGGSIIADTHGPRLQLTQDAQLYIDKIDPGGYWAPIVTLGENNCKLRLYNELELEVWKQIKITAGHLRVPGGYEIYMDSKGEGFKLGYFGASGYATVPAITRPDWKSGIGLGAGKLLGFASGGYTFLMQ